MLYNIVLIALADRMCWCEAVELELAVVDMMLATCKSTWIQFD